MALKKVIIPRPSKPFELPTKGEIVTYRYPERAVLDLRQEEPSCFNGEVRFRKYRVTFERVDEPHEVLAARIQTLWDTTTNHHHTDSLRNAAASIGYKLVGERGSARHKP